MFHYPFPSDQNQIYPFPVLWYSIMLCIKNTPIGVVSVFMQFFFKQPECGIPEFFSYNIFYIFVNSPYWFDTPYHTEPLHQKGRTCFINIMGTTHAAGVPFGIMYLQRVILIPAASAFPNRACLLACQGKILTGASSTDHVKRFNLPFVHFCNISQIQCLTCTMNRTITLCCIFIKLTKIHQTIFHSSYFMRCSYTFYLGLLTYFLLSPKFFIVFMRNPQLQTKYPSGITLQS